MSYSQASYFSDQFSKHDFFQSDDLLGLVSSQRTVASIPNSDFIRPLRYSRAPNSLKRVGPRLQKLWILYNSNAEMECSRTQFVEWWLKTEFGSKKDTYDSIRWDGKKKSDLWESFDQVAHEKTGEPKVMCKRCHTVLVHPNHRRAGCSPMKAHLKGGACRIGPTKRGIDQIIQSSVCLLPFLLSISC